MPSFSADSLARHETYRSLEALHNKFSRLSDLDFASVGSSHLAAISTEILNRVLKRFDQYSYQTVLLVSSDLLTYLQILFRAVSNSTSNEVAWSMIPSLSDLFSRYKINSEFVISSSWNRNYSIHPINALTRLKAYAVDKNGVLYETEEDSRRFFERFLTKHKCDNIWVMFYPRVKRLSATHFSIFGHELGHLVYQDWSKNNYSDFKNTHGLMDKVDTAIDEYCRKHNLSAEMRVDIEDQWKESIFASLEEVICDIVGCITFGFTFLLSLFKFSSIHNFEQHLIKYGYYSWAYRVQLCLDTLKILGSPFDGTFDKGIYKWIESIDAHCQQFHPEEEVRSNTRTGYHSILLDSIRNGLPDIVQDLKCYLDNCGLSYDADFKANDVSQVHQFLIEDVVPCANVYEDNNSIKYAPYNLRNIITGTWKYIIYNTEFSLDETMKYYKISRQANLLSLKGVEMARLLGSHG